MNQYFQPSRADGRSDKQVVYGLARTLEPGESLSYEKLLAALQEGLVRPVARSRVYRAVAAANRVLLREDKRYLQVVKDEGYRMLHAGEHLAVALNKKESAAECIRRGIELLRNARLDELDPAQRVLHEGQLMVMAAHHQMLQAHDRRLTRIEQTIRGLVGSQNLPG